MSAPTATHTRARRWPVALLVAVVVGLCRVLVDAAVPPHLQWWFSAVVAMIASLSTSWYWLTLDRRYR